MHSVNIFVYPTNKTRKEGDPGGRIHCRGCSDLSLTTCPPTSPHSTPPRGTCSIKDGVSIGSRYRQGVCLCTRDPQKGTGCPDIGDERPQRGIGAPSLPAYLKKKAVWQMEAPAVRVVLRVVIRRGTCVRRLYICIEGFFLDISYTGCFRKSVPPH